MDQEQPSVILESTSKHKIFTVVFFTFGLESASDLESHVTSRSVVLHTTCLPTRGKHQMRKASLLHLREGAGCGRCNLCPGDFDLESGNVSWR
jgi:hypothetical protein